MRAILISENALDPVVRCRPGHSVSAACELDGSDGRSSGSHLPATIRPLSDDLVPRNACRWWRPRTTEMRRCSRRRCRIYNGFLSWKNNPIFLGWRLPRQNQLARSIMQTDTSYCQSNDPILQHHAKRATHYHSKARYFFFIPLHCILFLVLYCIVLLYTALLFV